MTARATSAAGEGLVTVLPTGAGESLTASGARVSRTRRVETVIVGATVRRSRVFVMGCRASCEAAGGV